MKLICVFVIFFFVISKYSRAKKQPHIIFILADDLGWNDVSFHGSDEIITPNIDSIAYNGIILNNHYSESLCSPSRAALLTGKYPIHTGMQHNVIMETHPTGLSLAEKLLPQYLKSLGYKTHAIGKWHLGYYKKEYTPTYRGFDSFFGLWNGYHDYFKHNVQAWFTPYDGYDMRRNMEVDWTAFGKYSTDLFTDEAVNIIHSHNKSSPLFLYLAHVAPHAATFEDPLQVPVGEENKFSYLKNLQRRLYAAMVSKLDESVGKIIKALKENSLLDDSIIVFLSDNGAPTMGLMKNHGSNWPLKGEKSTPWEGGIKTVALIWSKLLKIKSTINRQLMHISDWLPTLYAIAGGNVKDLHNIDGTNMWDVLRGTKHEYTDYTMLHNIDEESGYGYAAIREGPFKLVNGTSMLGYLDLWLGMPQETGLPAYNIDAVMGSISNVILTFDENVLTNEKIQALRNAGKISCNASQKTNKTFKPCEPKKQPCLFNIFEDPCEQHNLYDQLTFQTVRKKLETKINEFRKTKIHIPKLYADKFSNPALYNNTWVNWGDMKGHSIIGS